MYRPGFSLVCFSVPKILQHIYVSFGDNTFDDAYYVVEITCNQFALLMKASNVIQAIAIKVYNTDKFPNLDKLLHLLSLSQFQMVHNLFPIALICYYVA